MAREYNMIYKNANGNNLVLENSSTEKINNITLYGETVRETKAAGKNILDPFTNLVPEFEGLTSTISEDGYITVTGVPENDYEPVVDYTVITDILEDGETYTLSMTNNNEYMWCEVTALENGTNKRWYSSRNNASIPVDKSTYTYRFRIITAAKSTWGSNSRTITSAFQLEKGAKTDYEVYSTEIQEPSVSDPSNIEILTGDVNVKFTTRNLLEKKTGTYTHNGITFTANEDGSVTANGTATGGNATWYYYDGATFKPRDLPAGTYRLSGAPAGSSGSTYHIRIIKQDDTGYYTYYQDYGLGKDFILESDSKIVCLILINSGQTVNNLTFYPQITKKGTRNLLNYNNCDFTANSTTWYFLDGVSGAYGSNIGTKTNVKVQVKNGKKYTISYNVSTAPLMMQLTYEDETILGTPQINTGYNNYTFTASRDGYVIPRVRVESDSSCKISNIQIEEGDTAHEYVPGYTPGNSQNMTLNLGVKNLWSFTEDKYYQSENATYQIIDKNTLKVSSTSSGTYRNVKFKLDIPDGTYTFSLGNVSNTNTNMTFKRMSLSTFTNGTRTVLKHIDQGTPQTITINNESGKQYALEFWATYSTSIENEATFSNIQVEKGSVAHDFYDSEAPIYNLCTLGDLENSIYYQEGKWYYSEQVGKVVLDGSETGVRRETNDNTKWRFCVNCPGVLRVPNSSTTPNIISDKFKTGTLTNQYTKINCISTGATTTDYYRDISIYYDAIDSYTFAQFQTWLNQNNITVLYELATPSITEITDTRLLSQLNNLRNVTTYDNYSTAKVVDKATGKYYNSGHIDLYYATNNSDEYFQALIDNTATIETIINILPLNSGESIINLNEENSVINWTHSDFRYVQNTEDKSQEGFIGQFVARTFDGKVIDLDDDFNIENHEIEVYLGIVNEEDTGYISLGNFIIESIERDEVDDTTSFKSSDYTMFFNQKFNGDYTDGTFTDSFNTKIQNGETVTALWLAQYTCAQAGVELGHTDFTNYDYVIASNQFDDQHTCRDVIKSIAKLAYSWARIGWDNKLYFDFTVDTEVNTDLNIITNENYYNLETQKEEIGEINKVILGSSIVSGNNQYIEDSASIEANGEHAIEIYDNPITYNDDTKIAALENGDVLYGLHYRPLSTLTTGHPWLQGNELIEIVDMEGNSIYTYPFDRTIEYNGHIKTKLDSYGATAVESTQSYYEGTDNITKQTKVELDRQNQRLTVAISELNGEIQDVSDEFNKLAEPSHTVRGTEISVDDGGEFNFKNFGIYGQLQQGDLPVQYTPVEYITNNGNQCYINSYFPRISSHDSTSYYWGISKFYFKLAINDLTQGGYIYGNVQEYLEYSTTSGLEFHIQGADITLLNRNDIDTNVHTYFIDNINHKFVVDAGVEQSYTVSSSGTSIMDRFIFNAKDYDNNIKTSPNINLYELKLYDIQNIINKDLVPVYNNKKEMYGLYNKITNEFFEANNPNLISGGNEIIPTYNSPIEIYPVKLDHTLNIQSKNLVDLENQMGKIGDYDINVENNTIILNGTSDTGGYQDFDQRYTYLDPGIYTLTCKFSGESGFEDEPGVALLFYGNDRRLADLGTDIVFDYFTGTYPEYYFTFEVSGDEASPFYFEVYTRTNANYINYKIDLCIEKGGESTGVSRHVESQSYTYDLGTDTVENQLCSIGNYYDFINYNITDEKWYKTKAIACKPLSSFVGTERASNNDYYVYGLSNTTLQYENPFNILNKNIPCYSTHFKWGGSVSDDSEALSKGVGMYTGNHNWNTFISGILYVVVPKEWVQSLSGSFADWCDENNVNVYYVQEDPVTEELPDYDLVIQLDNILANAKLYDTYMIVSDTPLQDSSCPAELEVTYMFNTTFNGSYATRTELQVTQNSIQTVVADTVSTTLDPITLGLEDLGDRVDTVEGNLQGDIDSLRGELGDYALQTDVVTLERSVTELQTSTAEVISVAKDIQVNGVSKVRTSTDFTFDEEGLMIAKTGAATKTQVTENGMSIYSTAGSTDEAMLTVNSQGVDAYNVKVGTYLLIGTHARMQDYEDGTGVFYIG